ncbi:MAG: hypothetical protein ICV64_12030 [Thermoleophilia bacterium]|nr:hypothetical protein [Thermoleophilia bacterium]
MTASLELAERALAAVRAGDGAQATVVGERSLMLRFARSQPTQATAVDDTSVEISVLRDGHVAGASTNGGTGDELAACAREAERAAEAAARHGEPGAYPGFPEPAGSRAHAGHDPETALLDPAAGGAALRQVFDAAASRGVDGHGIWTAGEVTTAIASTAGMLAIDRVTDAGLRVTCVAPGGRSGHAASTATATGAIDAAAVAARAASRASVRGEPKRLGSGDYAVVLECYAVAELLEQLGRLALNGLAYAEDRSAVSGRLGTQVAAPSVNLADSPRYARSLPRAFDAEGVPKRPMPLIQDGVAHAVVHDTRSGALAGVRSTGHALEPAGAPYGPRPTNMVLAAGGAADEAELCRPIERGVYVTRLWYTNPVRPKETLITGVTRDGTLLIEDGEVVAPLEDLRFTDTVLGVLERTQALTAQPTLVGDHGFYGRRFATGVVCPGLRASSMHFTGAVP